MILQVNLLLLYSFNIGPHMNIKEKDQHEIEHFTKLPHVWWGLKSKAGQKRYDNKCKSFLDFCHIKEGSKILEVGCGNGEFTKRLAKIKKGKITILGIDLTPSLISLAKKTNNSQNIHYTVDNLHKLSLKNGTFDVVCGISILHHVDLLKSLKEIHRVLKPNGEIFFTEPNMLNPIIFAGIHTPYLREKMEFSPDETAFIRFSLEKQIKKVGFKHVIVKNYDFLFPRTPKHLIPATEKIGKILERTPGIKEISGSLLIYAQK